MYGLAVCSDEMTEAKPRFIRQNRPASEYIIQHNALPCWWVQQLFAHMHLKKKKTKKVSVDNYNAALRGQVQVLVALTTKHDWALDWPTSVARATLL